MWLTWDLILSSGRRFEAGHPGIRFLLVILASLPALLSLLLSGSAPSKNPVLSPDVRGFGRAGRRRHYVHRSVAFLS
jgi:hypothetical protein